MVCVAGEVTIDLAQSPLDEEAEWHYLTTYKGRSLPDHLKRTFYADSGDLAPLPSTNYPPSRYSDSPVSDFEDGYSLYRDRLAEDYMLERPTRPRGWRSNSPPSHRLGPDSSPPRHIRCVHLYSPCYLYRCALSVVGVDTYLSPSGGILLLPQTIIKTPVSHPHPLPSG